MMHIYRIDKSVCSNIIYTYLLKGSLRVDGRPGVGGQAGHQRLPAGGGRALQHHGRHAARAALRAQARDTGGL